MGTSEDSSSESSGGLGLACWGAGLLAAAGVAAANRQVVSPDLGFLALVLGGVVGGLGAAALLVVGPRRWLTILVGGLPAVAVAAVFLQASRVPLTADVSTSPADPPAAPALGAPPMVALPHGPAAREALAGPYADLRPRLLPGMTPSEALPRLRELLAGEGLEVRPDPPGKNAAPGVYLHAVARSRLLRFEDDVLLRLRVGDGGTRLDVRSLSRVGQSDLGVNHARVKALLKRVDAALGARPL